MTENTIDRDAPVARLTWPDDRPTDRAVLWLVPPNVDPPRGLGVLEDWIRLPASTEDLEARHTTLALRAAMLAPP